MGGMLDVRDEEEEGGEEGGEVEGEEGRVKEG